MSTSHLALPRRETRLRRDGRGLQGRAHQDSAASSLLKRIMRNIDGVFPKISGIKFG